MDAELTRSLATAADLLARAQAVAVLTGAGVSAESGISTFRDAQTGLWSHFDPQQLASQSGFAANPGLVWRWYMHRLAAVEAATPNPGHLALAALERQTPHFTLITQNVDDLHERAGSTRTLHLHGHIARFFCNTCQAPYTLHPDDRTAPMPPECKFCTGYIRPGVVWFGELLPEREMWAAWQAADTCDLFLVIGTSGVVYPASQLPVRARRHGAPIIEVNPEPSELSVMADICLRGPSGVVLPQLLMAIRGR
ncbi:MAG TPA: NAD-dependent protein deacylase [Chloroflexi bacterium]|nr:NAD-dependent protein deacylase [Chloroflexota bacterium]HHW89122.1 NAD-dependent deacylase [Chloroflexota bacterium]